MMKGSIDDLQERCGDFVETARKSKERRGSTIWILEIPFSTSENAGTQ